MHSYGTLRFETSVTEQTILVETEVSLATYWVGVVVVVPDHRVRAKVEIYSDPDDELVRDSALVGLEVSTWPGNEEEWVSVDPESVPDSVSRELCRRGMELAEEEGE